MTRSLVAVTAFALLLPVAVEVPAGRDSSASGAETRLSIGGGVGYYALIERGCEGQILRHTPVNYNDLGVALEHQFNPPIVIGVRGGRLNDRIGPPSDYSTSGTAGPYPPDYIRNTSYWNPYASLEWRKFGIGGGYMDADKPFVTSGGEFHNTFTAHVRIGIVSQKYLLINWMEGVPLYGDGGYFGLGMGFRPHQNAQGFMGLNVGPFDGMGVSLKTDIWLSPSTALNLSGRLGGGGGQIQTGISAGITVRRAGPEGR
jgi:hypothetical protein